MIIIIILFVVEVASVVVVIVVLFVVHIGILTKIISSDKACHFPKLDVRFI